MNYFTRVYVSAHAKRAREFSHAAISHRSAEIFIHSFWGTILSLVFVEDEVFYRNTDAESMYPQSS